MAPRAGATRRRAEPVGNDEQDAGFSMIATMFSLVAVALLTLLLMSTTLNSSSPSATNISNAPGVGLADNLLAQQSLSTALTAVTTAASSAGGYGALDVGTLSASDPSVSYVAGATTSPSTVSVTVTSGSGVGTGTAGASPSGGGSGSIGSAISSAEAAGGAGAGAGGGAGANSGTVTLAARSSNGTCWLVWRGVGSAIWYGAQTDQPSCTAPGLVSTPSAGPVTSSSIGWQPGSFPSP